MKRLLISLLCLGFFITAQAQKVLPEVKVGTVLYCSAFVQGQELPLILTLKSIAGPVSIGWSVDGYGDGSFDMSAKALENANQFSVPTQPALGATKLGDTETFGFLSKAAYKSLMETKTFTYGGMKFKIKSSDASAMKIGGKEMDVSHVESEDGKLQLWILNNPNLPLMLQTAGLATDILVVDIK